MRGAGASAEGRVSRVTAGAGAGGGRRRGMAIAPVGHGFAFAQGGQGVDDFRERVLAEVLDGLDERDLEMQLLVGRPFHAVFGGGETVDQFQQPPGGNQRRLRLEHPDQVAGSFRPRALPGVDLEDEQVAKVADQLGKQSQEVLAALGLFVQHGERL